MNDERSFTRSIRQILDNSTEELDPGISRRLRLARSRALQHYEEKHNYWKPVGGFALTSMLLVAIGVWQFGGSESGNGMAQTMEELELFASSESLQLFEDLEFYQWLDVIEDNAS